MDHGRLRVRRVRRYRKARYPSRHPRAKRATSPARRVLRAAAGPAVALGLSAGAAACDGGVSLVGEDQDVEDAADASEATDETYLPPDEMIGGARPEGEYYTVYLSEAEGRALIAEAVHEERDEWADPCAAPTLAERLTGTPEDQPFEADGIQANVDLLAPAISVEWTEDCLGGYRPAVGFEFATEEAGDDEDLSRNPAGFTDAEEGVLPALRERYEAAIALLRATDFPYGVWDYGWYVDDSDRARAEQALRDAVRVLLDDLQRDGFI